MNKTFRPWDVDQHHMFPPSVRDFVPEGHPAYFVRKMVRVDLDLSAIYAAYDEARGHPPEPPPPSCPWTPPCWVTMDFIGPSNPLSSPRGRRR